MTPKHVTLELLEVTRFATPEEAQATYKNPRIMVMSETALAFKPWYKI